MATKKKSSSRKSAARKKPARAKSSGRRSVGKSRSAKRSRGSMTRKTPARRSSGRSGRKQSPVARATRVARGVVEQATVAVTTGVDVIKELGENLVDRVRNEQ